MKLRMWEGGLWTPLVLYFKATIVCLINPVAHEYLMFIIDTLKILRASKRRTIKVSEW